MVKKKIDKIAEFLRKQPPKLKVGRVRELTSKRLVQRARELTGVKPKVNILRSKDLHFGEPNREKKKGRDVFFK